MFGQETAVWFEREHAIVVPAIVKMLASADSARATTINKVVRDRAAT
jgi:hypothetical protein